jgi:hypothetical protein
MVIFVKGAAQLGQGIQDGVIERSFPARPRRHPRKRKGDFSRETSPPQFRFSEIRFWFQITTPVTPESFGTHEPKPTYASLFYDHTRCESFPTTADFQLPGPSLVADSRRRLLVRSLLWKIALPLKAILLSTNSNASGSCNFLLWK